MKTTDKNKEELRKKLREKIKYKGLSRLNSQKKDLIVDSELNKNGFNGMQDFISAISGLDTLIPVSDSDSKEAKIMKEQLQELKKLQSNMKK